MKREERDARVVCVCVCERERERESGRACVRACLRACLRACACVWWREVGDSARRRSACGRRGGVPVRVCGYGTRPAAGVAAVSGPEKSNRFEFRAAVSGGRRRRRA